MVVQINYRRPDVPRAEREARCADDRARRSLRVPGLLRKLRLDGGAERLAGGIAVFEDRASAGACAAGPGAARLRGDPDLSEVDLRERMRAITRAPPPRRKAAAE